jgi:phosphoglycerate dehydrogenase-like enzyme
VGVGVDSVDVPVATELGIAVTTTPGANEATVADHTIALLLALVRRTVEHDAGVRAGGWRRTGPCAPRLLSGSTVGLVGYGTIGRLVARRLSGFEVELLVTDPALAAPGAPVDGGVAVVTLAELLTRSDVVSLHCPLTAATRHLIGRRELALMPAHAVLVNTARGGLVNEAALVEALETGTIAGAALDVFELEPPASPALLGLPNVVLSPHLGGISTTSVAEMTRRATAAVIDVLQGRVPEDLVNPASLQAAAHPPTTRGDA